MSDQRQEIQRLEPFVSYFENGQWRSSPRVELSKRDYGRVVLYSDHLRAVTLAKIEVLESLLSEEMVPMRHSNDYAVRAVPQVSFLNKIAALRKEL